MTWQCPCGCALQLSHRDLAREQWLAEIAGDGPADGARINLTPTGPGSSDLIGEREPMAVMDCDECGRSTPVLAYLAEMLARWRMGGPLCDDCRGVAL